VSRHGYMTPLSKVPWYTLVHTGAHWYILVHTGAHWYTLTRRLSRPQSWTECFEKRKMLPLLEIEP
jgi:hypothetical protein